jgi:hypothetical protein
MIQNIIAVAGVIAHSSHAMLYRASRCVLARDTSSSLSTCVFAFMLFLRNNTADAGVCKEIARTSYTQENRYLICCAVSCV